MLDEYLDISMNDQKSEVIKQLYPPPLMNNKNFDTFPLPNEVIRETGIDIDNKLIGGDKHNIGLSRIDNTHVLDKTQPLIHTLNKKNDKSHDVKAIKNSELKRHPKNDSDDEDEIHNAVIKHIKNSDK
jgi:hypothetical protein